VIIGIDLGTTNCAAAVFRNGEVEMIPNSLGAVLTPSAVSIDENGNLLTGLPARERQSTHPFDTVTAFKRYMGTQKQMGLGKKSYNAEDLSALMLKAIKADAEAYLGEPVTEAVITVPAYFNDKQRKATRRAGELAGLKVERLINEPTAAALSYGIHQREKETRFLVFDLGGGTFDISILEIFEGVIEVRASAGDNRLGGEDFNEVIIELARRKFAGDIDAGEMVNNAELYQKMRAAAERARRALTESSLVTYTLVWKDKQHQMELSADDYETACEGLLKKLREPIVRSMRDSNVKSEMLDEVILVGGATRMPLVRKSVTKMFGRFPSTAINPDEAIARGAAIQAALKSRDSALSEVVVTDVCPFSLGIESAEQGARGNVVIGLFSPILERNCVVPASREEVFSTMSDNQREILVQVFQGESRWTRENVALGEVRVPVPPGKAGTVSIVVRFSYDINGLLEVDITVPQSGLTRQIVIVDREGVSEAEIERRRQELGKIKVHPRSSDAVKATLARAGRCYEDALGDERAFIGQMTAQFEAVVEGQDPRACEAARLELEAFLDRVEGKTFL
jgi:molecular chaperone HscC